MSQVFMDNVGNFRENIMEVKRFEDVPKEFKVVFRREYAMDDRGISFDEWLEEQRFEPGTYQQLRMK